MDPMDGERGIRLIQISDSHLLAEAGMLLRGVDADEGLAAVLNHPLVHDEGFDLLIHTGDLVQRGAPSPNPPAEHEEGSAGSDSGGAAAPDTADLRSYERLSEKLDELGRPVFCVPGNHDDQLMMELVGHLGPLRFQRQVVLGRWRLIMLDSTIPGMPGGHLSRAELRLLDDTLEANDEFALVCMHHAPVPIASAWLDTMTIDNADELFSILDRHSHVRAVVFGHVHQEFESRRGHVCLLGAPSTGLQFLPRAEEPELDAIGSGFRSFMLFPDGRLSSRVHRAGAAASGF